MFKKNFRRLWLFLNDIRREKRREKSLHSILILCLWMWTRSWFRFCIKFWVPVLCGSNSGVSAWLSPVLDLKSLCGRSTLGGGLRLGAHGSPTHHTALTTHLFKMPYILRHLLNDGLKDVLYFKEEFGCVSWGSPAGLEIRDCRWASLLNFILSTF